MRTNYVLIDFESVQPKSLAALSHDHFKILVFVGANQAKLPFEIAASLQVLGPRAEYIKISGSGQDALDFHIAYYVGKLAAVGADAYFHIISKDKGFDPLIQHLRSKGVRAGRVTAVTEIYAAKSPAERLQLTVAWLKKFKTQKPRSVKKLTSSINSYFQKQLSTSEIDDTIKALVAQGHLSIAGTEVDYLNNGG